MGPNLHHVDISEHARVGRCLELGLGERRLNPPLLLAAHLGLNPDQAATPVLVFVGLWMVLIVVVVVVVDVDVDLVVDLVGSPLSSIMVVVVVVVVVVGVVGVVGVVVILGVVVVVGPVPGGEGTAASRVTCQAARLHTHFHPYSWHHAHR